MALIKLMDKARAHIARRGELNLERLQAKYTFFRNIDYFLFSVSLYQNIPVHVNYQ